MKSTTILYGTLIATTTLANPVAPHHFCWLVGQTCQKAARSLEQLSSTYVERAAEAAFNACWIPSEPCSKQATEKRDVSPEAADDAEADHDFCNRPDQPCAKVKRVANAVAEAMAFPDALPGPEDVNGTANHYCYGTDQPCALARRSALALAQSLPLHLEERMSPFMNTHDPHRFCWLTGQACSEQKRDNTLESRMSPFMNTHDPHRFCWLTGQACSEQKRAALAGTEALADIEHEYLKRDVEYDATAAQEYCDSEAGPCSELKRFAAAIEDAIAESEVAARAVLSDEDREVEKRCYAAGGACELSQRMVENVESMMLKA